MKRNQVSGDQVLIATGSRPAVPRLAGLDRVPYLTSGLLTVNEEGELRELPPAGHPISKFGGA